MKRPLAVFGLSFFACTLAALRLTAVWLVAITAVLAVFLGVWLVFFCRVRRGLPAVVLAGLLCSCLVRMGYDALVLRPVQALAGSERQVTARVTEIAPGYSEDTIHATVQVLAVQGAEGLRPFTVRLWGLPAAGVGDVFTAPMAFEAFATTATRAAQQAKGYSLAASLTEEPVWQGASHTFTTRMRQLQYSASESIRAQLPGRLSSVLAAMAVGDRRFLSADTRDAYAAAGLSHLLVVSGLHLSILCGYLYRALGGRRRHRRLASVLCIALLLLFMAFTGLTPSVVRSGIVWLLVFAGGFWARRADSLTSLGLAAVVLLVLNPYAAADGGLLLSFSATLGAVASGTAEAKLRRHWVDRPAARWPQNAARRLAAAALTPLCVTVATLPVLVWLGMSVSLFTLPMNLLAVPLLPLVVVCGFAMLLAPVPLLGLLAPAAALVGGAILTVFEWLTNLCARLPGAVIPVGGLYALCVVLALYLLAAAAYKTKRYKTLALGALVLVPVAALLHVGLSAGTVRITVAGNAANSAVVVTSGGRAVVLYRSRQAANAVAQTLRENRAEECVLFIDLRRTADSTGDIESFAPQTLVVAQTDILAGQVFKPFEDVDVQISVARQGTGTVACVDVAGYKLGLCTGRVDLGPYAPLDVLVAGTGAVQGEYAALLYGGSLPEWANETATPLQSDGTAVLWLRPGKSIKWMEVLNGTE